jgi:RNA polymerase sigma-70 factor (ECF subfamily)
MFALATRRPESSRRDLLQQARSGSGEALGQLLEACRTYLLVIARRHLRASLQAKVDAADLVQETFIEATRDFARFRGVSEQELLGWLRGILRHNLADLSRCFAMRCRCVNLEVRLREAVALDLVAHGERSNPQSICEQMIAQEQQDALAAALQRLPPRYRQVLQLRYDACCSFAEIGNCLQRSPEAVRKLWRRALVRLRQDLRRYAEV